MNANAIPFTALFFLNFFVLKFIRAVKIFCKIKNGLKKKFCNESKNTNKESERESVQISALGSPLMHKRGAKTCIKKFLDVKAHIRDKS